MPLAAVIAPGVGCCWGHGAAGRLCVAVATCLAFFPAGATAGPAVIIIFDARSLVGVAVLVLASRSSSQCVKLSVERGLRLDEASTVVAHWLVAGIGVLGCDGNDGCDQDDDQQDQRKGSIVDEEDHTHDTSDDTLFSC